MTRLARLLVGVFLAMCAVACGSGSAHSDPVPDHDAFSLPSAILDEDRVINVFTPPIYADGEAALPVIFMPDGGIEEDFPHIANTIASLIEAKKIPPAILVGIENTERGRDLTPGSSTDYDRDYAPQTDGASNFRAFIRDELMPVVQARYRTAGRPTILGESSAGLFVIDTFFREPGLFAHYIAMDPALWWDDHAIVRRAAKSLPTIPDQGTSLWFTGSDAKDIQPHTRALANTLKKSAPAELRWKYVDKPGEQHSTIFRATKEQALIWSLGRPELTP